ncbi:MAG: adenylate/guanylate cyclase domain-containing protein [Bacteroidia bacterium]
MSLPDSSRFGAMADIIEHGKIYSYYDSIAYYSKLEFREAKSLGLEKYIAHSILWKSVDCMGKNLYNEGMQKLDSAISIYKNIGDNIGIANGEAYKGMYLLLLNDDENGLSMIENAYNKMYNINHTKGQLHCAATLVTAYGYTGNFSKRMRYATLSLKLAKELGSWVNLAETYHAMADLYLHLEINEEGEFYHEQALKYSRMGEYVYEEINILNHISSLAMYKGDFETTIEILNRVGQWQKKYGGPYERISFKSKEIYVYTKAKMFAESKKQIEIFRTNYTKEILLAPFYKGYVDYSEGMMFMESGDFKKAAKLCLEAINGYKVYNQHRLEVEACECAYQAYKKLGSYKDAIEINELKRGIEAEMHKEDKVKGLRGFEFHRKTVADSLAEVEKDRLIEMQYNKELNKKNKTKNIALGSGAFLLLLVGGVVSRNRYINKAKNIIEKEKELVEQERARSDELLLNILPAKVAKELKETGEAQAQHFDHVSILFTDFKEFTETAEKLNAQQLVNEINTCFKAFDNICDKYNIEKIKTIGDSYMAASGLGHGSKDKVRSSKNASNLVRAALDMQKFITLNSSPDQIGVKQRTLNFTMRAGIHTGPVVAGIVGVKKFQYDIWGDTVNTASRMESHGEVGKVNISEATYEILKDEQDLAFEERGKIDAKGKGEIEMYFVGKRHKGTL